MTHFIKLNNGVPEGNVIVEENLRQVLTNATFPPVVTDSFIEPFGYGVYDFRNQPPIARYQKNIEVTPVKNQYGIWCQTWQTVEMSSSEKTLEDERKAAEVRFNRNQKLYSSDWTQMADAPVDKTAWAAYRQELRDLTSQTGFPWDITWPSQPE
jgi:hypothetical protein